MDYSEYTGNRSSLSEYIFKVSDGTGLHIFDFTPVKEVRGRPVIIFIAGWISLISGWKDFLAGITPLYHVIYVETREKNSSLVPDIKAASFDMGRMKDDIGDVITGLVPEREKFVLAGSSLGASAIMEYCRSARRLPLCTALVGPNSRFRFPGVLAAIIPFLHPSLYFAVKPVVKWYLRNFRVNSAAEKEQIEKYELTLDLADPYKLKKNAMGIQNWSMEGWSGKITVPSLILGATTDSLHSTDQLKGMLSHFEKPLYVELASNRETHSARAAQVMMEYIKSITSPGKAKKTRAHYSGPGQ